MTRRPSSAGWASLARVAAALLPLFFTFGCATIRVTDPARTATEQFLMSIASSKAVDQLRPDALRDRKVYVDSTYLTAAQQPSAENSFLLGELRARLLLGGVRLVNKRSNAQIILEVRSGGVGIDRVEFLLGIPATPVPGTQAPVGSAPLTTPELAILKSTKQYGFSSVAFVAYWADSGELVGTSGPFIGRTYRQDWWILGFGPRTVGNIPPAKVSK